MYKSVVYSSQISLVPIHSSAPEDEGLGSPGREVRTRSLESGAHVNWRLLQLRYYAHTVSYVSQFKSGIGSTIGKVMD